ncbi:MAG: hypothetical protein KGI94_04525 [Paracoccaceae bacterium]|nr:hypothetical protein [Paracoccaceae bacterium]
MKTTSFTLTLALVLGLPALAVADPAKTMDSAKGKIFTDAKGMSLYTFDNDKGGKSACNGPCAVNWPPLMAAASDKASGKWTVITRNDGGKQWA